MNNNGQPRKINLLLLTTRMLSISQPYNELTISLVTADFIITYNNLKNYIIQYNNVVYLMCDIHPAYSKEYEPGYFYVYYPHNKLFSNLMLSLMNTLSQCRHWVRHKYKAQCLNLRMHQVI